MKLYSILASRDAWQRLTALKMPPAKAYRLRKYCRMVDADLAVIEEERVKLLREASGVMEGAVALQEGTPEHQDFILKFAEFLTADSDLPTIDADLDEIIEMLNGEQSNAISVADLAALEPFFKAEGV